MTTIEAVIEKLRKHPNVKYDVKDNGIAVQPQSADGFHVTLQVNSESYYVSFEGWHEEFASADEALNCFAFGLSEECRLKVTRRCGFAYRWTVQNKTDDGWTDDSETGLLFFPFWGRKEELYLQNHILKSGAPN